MKEDRTTNVRILICIGHGSLQSGRANEQAENDEPVALYKALSGP